MRAEHVKPDGTILAPKSEWTDEDWRLYNAIQHLRSELLRQEKLQMEIQHKKKGLIGRLKDWLYGQQPEGSQKP